MKTLKKMLSVGLSLVMCAGMVTPAFAARYDITKGDVNVTSEGSTGWDADKNEMSSSTDKDITIVGNGEETTNTITVGANVKDTTITLNGVNIKSGSDAALSVGSGSNVTVELEGKNTLTSADSHAGLELKGDANVTIQDADKDGSLTANGGKGGAGIGAANYQGINGSITIDGAEVEANGGTGGFNNGGPANGGAGIGAGAVGAMGANIEIKNDSDVTANGYGFGAGIGGGDGEMFGSVSIDASSVTATNHDGNAAGIGGGGGGKMSGSITIENIGADQQLTAEGGASAAGIGGGGGDMAGSILISDSLNVTAIGGINGAGIGSANGEMSGIISIAGSQVTAGSSGANSAGIGAGHAKVSGDISIQSSIITAVGDNTAAIGTGFGEMTGKIEMDEKTVLRALSNADDKWSVTEKDDESDVMHGRFAPGFLETVTDTVFYLVDDNGKPVTDMLNQPVSFNVKFNDKTYRTFAIDLPGAGTYYLVQRDDEGKIVGYVVFGENDVAYKTDDTGVVRQDGLQVAGTKVSYAYSNEDLPKDVVFPEASADLEADTVVEGNGGKWVFQGWTSDAPTEPVLKDGKLVTDYVVTGSWTFVADPVPPAPAPNPGTVIPDGNVPMGELPEADAGIEIEDEAVPLAGLFTRADAIGYLWEKSGSPEWELSDFPDVPEDHYWAVAIGWAQDMGIAVADVDGNFRPDDLVLRSVESLEISPEGELQEFLNRYAVYAGIELDDGELFIELDGGWADIIMGEEAQEIFDDFFALLVLALEQAA